MKRMGKRVFSVLLAVCLLGCTAAGCGSSEKGSTAAGSFALQGAAVYPGESVSKEDLVYTLRVSSLTFEEERLCLSGLISVGEGEEQEFSMEGIPYHTQIIFLMDKGGYTVVPFSQKAGPEILCLNLVRKGEDAEPLPVFQEVVAEKPFIELAVRMGEESVWFQGALPESFDFSRLEKEALVPEENSMGALAHWDYDFFAKGIAQSEAEVLRVEASWGTFPQMYPAAAEARWGVSQKAQEKDEEEKKALQKAISQADAVTYRAGGKNSDAAPVELNDEQKEEVKAFFQAPWEQAEEEMDVDALKSLSFSGPGGEVVVGFVQEEGKLLFYAEGKGRWKISAE